MKQLLERVSENTRKRGASSGKGAAKIYIIAHRDQIQKTLAHGYDVKTIWATLKEEGTLNCNYSYFCQMLKKYLHPKKDAAED